mmetsp:Transcript_16735/g.37030  ORF Transcript_16735/g.37030 Transcript_16735/m.37030 type:complete len:567 (-) Transcript_16735:228-1928(-)|eukprot:CAMPEP_0204307726 /NCGR_PEP_ID=MMETSP0469-20131031/79_1 /ASSEMBLY_ACC=CAM_ASM_000384 /TAXON_ID=2969 /ORGANISM="Oxyrrhis marina" /LENGTH=566 /DNA_ID=CAMNT_0051287103 /DNA_START=25 /DNA_END=1725 /DNA_ORIENTATION=-
MADPEAKARAASHKAKGNAAFAAKSFTEAIGHFTEAIQADPSDHLFYSNRSACYASVERYQEALDDGIQCVVLKPDWPKGYSRKAHAEFFLGKHEEAEKTYQEGLKLAPEDAALKAGLQQVLDQKNKSASSALDMGLLIGAVQRNRKIAEYLKDPGFLKSFQTVIQAQHDPKLVPVVQQMVLTDPRIKELLRTLQGRDSPERSAPKPVPSEPPTKKAKTEKEAEIKAADERSDEQKEADQWKDQGNTAFKAKNFEEAAEKYRKAIEILRDEMSYYSNLGAVLIEMDKHEEAIQTCQGALDRRYEMNTANPGGASYEKVAKALCRIASAYAKRKQFEKAREFYDKALVEDNNRFTRQAVRDLERARDKWEKEQMLDPAKAEEHKQQGNDFFKEQKFVEAKQAYDEALKRNPKDATVFANRAAALTKLLSFPDALRDLEEALKLDPSYVKAHHRKGTCHLLMKEYHKALKAFEAGLAIDADNEPCKKGKAQVMATIQQQQASGEVDEEQVRHAMADPEIQKILSDPQVNMVLKKMEENPAMASDVLKKDPQMKAAVEKLIFAGIVKVR